MAGAGVARELALRGVSVALVEKGDFASATTSQSSKLVHGGLRYLELFDFGLVRESLRERETLRRLAPHLVARKAVVEGHASLLISGVTAVEGDFSSGQVIAVKDTEGNAVGRAAGARTVARVGCRRL